MAGAADAWLWCAPGRCRRDGSRILIGPLLLLLRQPGREAEDDGGADMTERDWGGLRQSLTPPEMKMLLERDRDGWRVHRATLFSEPMAAKRLAG